MKSDPSTTLIGLEQQPLPPPGYTYSQYHGEHVDVIHMYGDVAHCDSDDTDEDIISTTILVHSNPTTSNGSSIDHLKMIVSPPPGFHHVKPKVTVDKYDCIIRERRGGAPGWPLSWGSFWDSMKGSHHLDQIMLMQQQQEVNGSGLLPCWMMLGLVQYPTNNGLGVGGGEAKKLEFWFVEGKSKINSTSIPEAMMVHLDGHNMIHKVQSIAAAANMEEGELRFSKNQQFWVHLIDANVFVAQDSDQVVHAIEKLLKTYGCFHPQGVIEGPVQQAIATPPHALERQQQQSAWPGENYNVNVYDDDIFDDLTQETMSSLQDAEDDNDSGDDIIYDMNNIDISFPARGQQRLQQRPRSMSLGQINPRRRRLFHRSNISTTSSRADIGVGGGDGQTRGNGGRFWTAFSRGGAPMRARSRTLIDV